MVVNSGEQEGAKAKLLKWADSLTEEQASEALGLLDRLSRWRAVADKRRGLYASSGSLVDELLAERRAEADREAREE